MEELFIHIRNKAEEILDAKVDYIEKFENVLNNSVYKILVKNKLYIFKIYKLRDWPEDGKLLFINNKLFENKIGCAKIIAFDRNDSYFENGFLIEECLPGKTADKFNFTLEQKKEFYIKFARLVSEVHKIRITNYGYIGSGIGCYDSLPEFFIDVFDELSKNLINHNLFEKNTLEIIKEKFVEKVKLCDSFPSVLCHGDLSTKNVIIDEYGDLKLIDWDDAISYSWPADLARLTSWMKLNYNADEFEVIRSTFLENYSTKDSKSIFYDFEDTFHIYFELDYMNFYIGTPQYEIAKKYFLEAVEKLIK